MKEASGEANMTVITIVLIAIVLGVGTLLVTRFMTSTRQKGCCTDAGGVWRSGACADSGAGTYDNATYQACLNATNRNNNNNNNNGN